MHPTLASGERVLFDTVAYRSGRPQKGDIVLARHPQRPSMMLVKRVTAAPGDRVTVGPGGWQLEEPSQEQAPAAGASPTETRRLGEDQYFLVGDAPAMSTDARHFGLTHRTDILGRAWLVYWPPQRLRLVHPEQVAEQG